LAVSLLAHKNYGKAIRIISVENLHFEGAAVGDLAEPSTTIAEVIAE
jgi:hypothetical protein